MSRPRQQQPGSSTRRPLYPRLLGLRHVQLSAWERALFGEGTIAVAVLLVLADLASAWTLVVLPPAVALVVKAHDVLAGILTPAHPGTATAPDPGAGPGAVGRRGAGG